MLRVRRSNLLFLIAFVLIDIVKCKNPYFEPCKVSSPDFNRCLKTTAQGLVKYFVNGEPALNLQGLKPFYIEKIENGGGVLKLSFSNNILYGADTIEIKDIRVDPKKKKIFFLHTSHGYMASDYKVDGRLVIFPVTGSGKSNVTLDETEYKYDMEYDVVKGKDGRNHWKIKKHQISFSPIGVQFSFENLFNGNKQLSDNIHKFANENWKEIFSEMGPPLMAKVTGRMVKEINKFLASIPEEDMILP